ncbi:4-hydroxy-tetrahydrodipicolinate synthase [Nocardioides sp. YR527]|uniref:dihydrodipicolinate synthase family protein n=1 Tax=Nocardioides sp. YR527 TaxID=1881028 RepID=UPI00088681D8|nr:dihydrodipicolinate synthase family protein [Nocardioides sp. YR527]SDK22302.1 4-hydroxy-tetrahydrodipicolinate synthase [Nocardioides sp. YR527]
MTTELHGVLTALTTPFNPDESIDVATLRKVVDRSIDAGVNGVVAAGSTGEVGSLSSDERLLLVDTIIEQTAGRVPVVAQTGATTTAEAIRLSQAAQRSGADVLMLLTPFYEPLSEAETVSYIKDVAGSVDIPVMLYNIPPVTGVNLAPDTVRALATEVDNIRYIKDSSANWEQALTLIHDHSDVIGTIVGWDVYTYSALAEGAVAVMAGAANVVPDEIVTVTRLIAEGNLTDALAEWKRVYPVISHLFATGFIPGIKAGLELQGIPVGVPRRPLAPLAAEDVEGLRSLLKALGKEVG